MNRAKSVRWRRVKPRGKSLPALLGDAYSVTLDKQATRTIELFDDFNRSLTMKGIVLLRDQQGARIVDIRDLRPETGNSRSLRKKSTFFWWDFESGRLQDILRKRLKLHAAIRLAKVQLRVREFIIRNKKGDSLARVSKETILIGRTTASEFLRLSHLVGYKKKTSAISRRITKSMSFKRSDDPLALEIVRLACKDQPPLSLKQAIHLKPDETVQEVVTKLAQFMIRTTSQFEPGIIMDTDTEFLHQYRVSLRRLRSLFSIVKGAYPMSDEKRLKDDFGDYAQATNRVRDLDVCLLREEEYRKSVPRFLEDGLDRFFTDLKSERAREFQKLRRWLKSKSYTERKEENQKWLGQSILPKGPNASKCIYIVVTKEIRLRYKSLRKGGRMINEITSDEALHHLRIECKKLRYLLMLFESLFRHVNTRKISRSLSNLQDILGRFNDHIVLQKTMLGYLYRTKGLDTLTIAAIGALIQSSALDREKGLREVALRFERFNKTPTKKVFNELLTAKQCDRK